LSIRHQVKLGDCLLSIAGSHGFRDWEAIWKLPENEELRARRPDSSVLAEGDEVFVPDPRAKQIVVDTNQRHRIVVSLPPAAIRAQLLHLDGTPMSACKYTLACAETEVEGQTDDKGWLEKEIPCRVQGLVLTVYLSADKTGPRYAWRLSAGHLDPVDTDTGLRQRLANLGYWPLAEDDEAALPYGLRAFQEDHGMQPTGEPDDETREKLKEAHGGI
jgi:hypothetical protein